MCKYSLIDILNLPDTNGQWFLLISSFDVIDFPNSIRVLRQTSQTVNGVRGHSNNLALLQRLHGAAQDFIITVAIIIFNPQNNNDQHGCIISTLKDKDLIVNDNSTLRCVRVRRKRSKTFCHL